MPDLGFGIYIDNLNTETQFKKKTINKGISKFLRLFQDLNTLPLPTNNCHTLHIDRRSLKKLAVLFSHICRGCVIT